MRLHNAVAFVTGGAGFIGSAVVQGEMARS
jgi:nucleoside-diphosphate-sugar epimerase